MAVRYERSAKPSTGRPIRSATKPTCAPFSAGSRAEPSCLDALERVGHLRTELAGDHDVLGLVRVAAVVTRLVLHHGVAAERVRDRVDGDELAAAAELELL